MLHNDGARWAEGFETVCRKRQCFELMVLTVKGRHSSSITTEKLLSCEQSTRLTAPAQERHSRPQQPSAAPSEYLPRRLTVFIDCHDIFDISVLLPLRGARALSP